MFIYTSFQERKSDYNARAVNHLMAIRNYVSDMRLNRNLLQRLRVPEKFATHHSSNYSLLRIKNH